jgi:hypothetical protein
VRPAPAGAGRNQAPAARQLIVPQAGLPGNQQKPKDDYGTI